MVKRDCQKKCQHTSCQACYFKTKRESPCPKCLTDDYSCMKKFSKCIRAETCTRQKHPCKAHKKVRETLFRGARHFRNLVHFFKKPREPSRIPKDSGRIPQNSENPDDLDSIKSSRILKNPQEFLGITRNPQESSVDPQNPKKS